MDTTHLSSDLPAELWMTQRSAPSSNRRAPADASSNARRPETHQLSTTHHLILERGLLDLFCSKAEVSSDLGEDRARPNSPPMSSAPSGPVLPD